MKFILINIFLNITRFFDSSNQIYLDDLCKTEIINDKVKRRFTKKYNKTDIIRNNKENNIKLKTYMPVKKIRRNKRHF